MEQWRKWTTALLSVCALISLEFYLFRIKEVISKPVKPKRFEPRPRHMTVTSQFDNPIRERRIVFIKTHKTGSTTMTSMFERYGYYRNSTFVVGRSFVFSNKAKFTRNLACSFPGMRGRPYDMLANHAIFNRDEMNSLVPNATYITIIRNPVTQLESTFAYFQMQKVLNLDTEPNPFKTFMADPMTYYNKSRNGRWFQTRNGMLFDLGFNHQYDSNQEKIRQKINEIERDFDLVLLVEYFDESLILMKKLLGWEFDDIFYLRKNTRDGVSKRGQRFPIDNDTKERIRDWSAGDVQLYDTFNRTFWKRVANYGPSFYTDLRYFRVMNSAISAYCEQDEGERIELPSELQGRLVNCSDLIRGDIPYTNLIRKSMKRRFGACLKWKQENERKPF